MMLKKEDMMLKKEIMMLTLPSPKQENRNRLGMPTLVVFCLLACTLAWLPASARAQIFLSVAPGSVSGLPGQAGIFVFGSLTNTGSTSADLDNAYFNLFSGPAGADLTSALTFSNYEAPLTLGAGQVYTGALFTVDADPAALLGTYTGNFSVSYGGGAAGQDVSFAVGSSGPTPVPEASTLPLLAAGCLWIGGMLWLRRRQVLGASFC